MKELQLCIFKGLSILEQLKIEEGLLRTNRSNWCIINQGSPPAIVMGISGKPEQLINFDVYQEAPVPLIRRFSGGGTVVVDEHTLFATFLIQKNSIDLSNPHGILQWTCSIYDPVFKPHDFSLRENDYAIGNRKIGGNAQYITKECWLHHTTFLWDYQHSLMNLLKMPPKAPQYRDGRSHQDFITRLKNFYPSQETIVQCLIESLAQSFSITPFPSELLLSLAFPEHRRSVQLVNLSEQSRISLLS